MTESHASLEFAKALICDGLSPEIDPADDIYGFLIGNWQFEATDHLPDGVLRRCSGEVSCARVLEGRAVEDIWIAPRCAERSAATPKAGNRYGVTLRWWAPELKAWRVLWINPVNGYRAELVARRVGEDIVQIGSDAAGNMMRWRFMHIQTNTFYWLGERLTEDGQSWVIEDEFEMRRLLSENNDRQVSPPESA
jgi:hypothetical protein